MGYEESCDLGLTAELVPEGIKGSLVLVLVLVFSLLEVEGRTVRAACVLPILCLAGSPPAHLLIAYGYSDFSLALPIRNQSAIVSIFYPQKRIQFIIVEYSVGMISLATVRSPSPAREGINIWPYIKNYGQKLSYRRPDPEISVVARHCS